jgi:hypothetical protein
VKEKSFCIFIGGEKEHLFNTLKTLFTRNYTHHNGLDIRTQELLQPFYLRGSKTRSAQSLGHCTSMGGL